MIAIVTIHLEDPLSWADLRARLCSEGDPQYAFIESHKLDELTRKSHPTSKLLDGTQLVGIRVGRTLVLPIWDTESEVAEIEVEDGKA